MRLDPVVQRGIGDGMRRDRAREEEQQEQEDQLQRHERQAGLQHEAEQQQAGAERVGDARRVHARVEVGHAHEPDRADDREEAAGEDQGPADAIEKEVHHDAFSSPSWARSPWRKNLRTASVPMRLSRP